MNQGLPFTTGELLVRNAYGVFFVIVGTYALSRVWAMVKKDASIELLTQQRLSSIPPRKLVLSQFYIALLYLTPGYTLFALLGVSELLYFSGGDWSLLHKSGLIRTILNFYLIFLAIILFLMVMASNSREPNLKSRVGVLSLLTMLYGLGFIRVIPGLITDHSGNSSVGTREWWGIISVDSPYFSTLLLASLSLHLLVMALANKRYQINNQSRQITVFLIFLSLMFHAYGYLNALGLAQGEKFLMFLYLGVQLMMLFTFVALTNPSEYIDMKQFNRFFIYLKKRNFRDILNAIPTGSAVFLMTILLYLIFFWKSPSFNLLVAFSMIIFFRDILVMLGISTSFLTEREKRRSMTGYLFVVTLFLPMILSNFLPAEFMVLLTPFAGLFFTGGFSDGIGMGYGIILLIQVGAAALYFNRQLRRGRQIIKRLLTL